MEFAIVWCGLDDVYVLYLPSVCYGLRAARALPHAGETVQHWVTREHWVTRDRSALNAIHLIANGACPDNFY